MTIAIPVAAFLVLTVGALSLVFYERPVPDVLRSVRSALARQRGRLRPFTPQPRHLGSRT